MCDRCEEIRRLVGAYPAKCDVCGRDVPHTASVGPEADSAALCAGYDVVGKTYMYHDTMGGAIYAWHYKATQEELSATPEND